MATLHHHPENDSFEPMGFDGPFPFTVALWQEVARCSDCGLRLDHPAYLNGPCPSCDNHRGRMVPFGAVTGLVEVTGPSHHADECRRVRDHYPEHRTATGRAGQRFCTPDAKPDCWHTPVGGVTVLDPVPMERPRKMDVRGDELHSPHCFGGGGSKFADLDCCASGQPASSWWGSVPEGTRL